MPRNRKLKDKYGADAVAEFVNPFTNVEHTDQYQLFYDTLRKLVFSNFKWYGLTNSEAQVIEYNLIMTKRVGAVKTKFDASTKTPDGVFYGPYGIDTSKEVIYDFYGNPNALSVTGVNGNIFTSNEYAIGYDSMDFYINQPMGRPVFSYLRQLAFELNDSWQMWKTAAETRKNGVIIQCSDERVKRNIEKVLNAKSENSPYIVLTGDISNQTEVLFRNSVGSDISEYYMHYMNTWGSVLDLLGLENNSQNKRERLVVTEAEMNRSLSRYLGADRLKARKQFAEDISELTGRKITVENYLASTITENMNAANEYGLGELDDEVQRLV